MCVLLSKASLSLISRLCRSPPVLTAYAGIAADCEQLGFLLDLGRTLGLALDPLRTRRIRECRFALRAVAFQLAMGAGGALRAAAFHLPVRAGDALCVSVFHRAVGTRGTLLAVALQLPVGSRLALHAAVFQLAVNAGVALHAALFHLDVGTRVTLFTRAFRLLCGHRFSPAIIHLRARLRLRPASHDVRRPE